MRYFFDTEFIEDGRTIDLLSIGIIAEDHRELYLENSEAVLDKASPWVREHVFTNMEWTPEVQVDRRTMAICVWEFIAGVRVDALGWNGRDFPPLPMKEKPEFWAYFSSYDWVVLCQLFGRMIDLPEGMPKRCNDIAQVVPTGADVPVIPPGKAHNALVDARWVRDVWDRHIGPISLSG
jgi:hypothetical protein